MPNKVSITETDPADLIGAEVPCPEKGANFSSASYYFSTGIMSCNMTLQSHQDKTYFMFVRQRIISYGSL